jgi:hypothetical protein
VRSSGKSEGPRCTRGLSAALAAAVLLVSAAAMASTVGRTVLVRNNTNATIFVSFGAGDEIIPPLTEKSFFNRLRRGRNQLGFYAKCVNREPRVYKSVWVSGQETRAKVVELFPRDFGKTTMFDGPGCSCLKILGTWKWFTGAAVKINDNSTFTSSDGNSGIWVCTDLNTVRMKWRKGGWVDEVRVSNDGRSLSGKNQHGAPINATKQGGGRAGGNAPPKGGCGGGGYNPYGCPK